MSALIVTDLPEPAVPWMSAPAESDRSRKTGREATGPRAREIPSGRRICSSRPTGPSGGSG